MTEILVCIGCNRDTQIVDRPSCYGKMLFAKMQRLQSANPYHFVITPVECLSACDLGCIVAFRAKDKPTYVLAELLPENAKDILNLANLYDGGNGELEWDDRPLCLRKQIVKLPVQSAGN